MLEQVKYGSKKWEMNGSVEMLIVVCFVLFFCMIFSEVCFLQVVATYGFHCGRENK